MCNQANYRTAISKRCLKQRPQSPSPIGRGWRLEPDQGIEQLSVDCIEDLPMPEAVLDLWACTCYM